MLRRIVLALVAFLALGANQMVQAQPAAKSDKANLVYLETKDGRITILLRPDLAPKHVARIKELTKRKFYDNIVFHRVIDGFMAQTGDPKGGPGGAMALRAGVHGTAPLHCMCRRRER